MKIDYTKLEKICKASIKDFNTIGEELNGINGELYYKSNENNKVLAVAHLDYVADNKAFEVMDCTFQGVPDIATFNGALDDRLGVYAIIELLPKLGLNYDILLTDNEERGQTTARHFKTNKSYNWMFQFDRRGDGCVMYQYHNKESQELLEGYGFNVQIGSFSDISELGALGCIGFNFGTGYYNEHTKEHFASENVFLSQITKFVKFFNDNKDKKMPYQLTDNYHGRYVQFNDYEWLDDKPYTYHGEFCDLCGQEMPNEFLTLTQGLELCDSCFGESVYCTVCQNICFGYETIDGVCIDCQDWSEY